MSQSGLKDCRMAVRKDLFTTAFVIGKYFTSATVQMSVAVFSGLGKSVETGLFRVDKIIKCHKSNAPYFWVLSLWGGNFNLLRQASYGKQMGAIRKRKPGFN